MVFFVHLHCVQQLLSRVAQCLFCVQWRLIDELIVTAPEIVHFNVAIAGEHYIYDDQDLKLALTAELDQVHLEFGFCCFDALLALFV